jgi:hypothetical protein
VNNDKLKVWTFEIDGQTYGFDSPPQVGMKFKLEAVQFEVIDIVKGEYPDGSHYYDLKVKPLFTGAQQAILELFESVGINRISVRSGS